MTHELARLTRATWLGVHAAVRIPRAMAGAEMAALLRQPADWPATSPPARDVSRATAIAFTFIRHLARLPGARWRNTCLFRAAAECWILRAHGLPAVLRLGVARTGTSPYPSLHDMIPSSATQSSVAKAGQPLSALGDVAAHAWVECTGVRCRTAVGGERDAYVLLESHR